MSFFTPNSSIVDDYNLNYLFKSFGSFFPFMYANKRFGLHQDQISPDWNKNYTSCRTILCSSNHLYIIQIIVGITICGVNLIIFFLDRLIVNHIQIGVTSQQRSIISIWIHPMKCIDTIQYIHCIFSGCSRYSYFDNRVFIIIIHFSHPRVLERLKMRLYSAQ